jgi:hypothetical protein
MEIVKPEKDERRNLDYCCGKCPFFSSLENPRAREPTGECRHSPPVALLMPVAVMQGQALALQSVFPVITESGWCGNHPRRKALAAAALPAMTEAILKGN